MPTFKPNVPLTPIRLDLRHFELPGFDIGDMFRSTDFTVAEHGFGFTNRFHNHRFWAGIHLNFGGRCGGMVYAALDHYRLHLPIPDQETLPTEGSALSTYISVRQETSTLGNVDHWVELVLGQPARSAEFFGWGMQEQGGQAGRLKEHIDRGQPVPLGLVAANDLLNHHHQVLAIGYCGEGEDLRIEVYDPNKKTASRVLRPFPDRQVWGFVDQGVDRARWRTYFVDEAYRVRDPEVLRTDVQDHSGADFRGQNLHGRQFSCDNLEGADFTGATATWANFDMAYARVAKFEGANLRHAGFAEANLERAVFRGADLKTATLARARAPRASFYGADLKLVNEQVDDLDMGQIDLERADFTGADLHRAKLCGIRAFRATFLGANLSHGNFARADFTEANLEGADLREADLRRANFTDADLDGADLRGADTTGAIGIPGRI